MPSFAGHSFSIEGISYNYDVTATLSEEVVDSYDGRSNYIAKYGICDIENSSKKTRDGSFFVFEVGLVVTKGLRICKNLAPGDKIGEAILFPASQIIKSGFSGRRNFVILESGELVIEKTGHLSLSQGANVLSAGEARFVNGALNSINNASGHFKPFGSSAANAAESAFGNAGFEAAGKFIEKTF